MAKIRKTQMLSLNESALRSVMKKIISGTSTETMLFEKMILSITDSGYGFYITKEKQLFSVRCKDSTVKVAVRNDNVGYAQNFLISDTPIEKLTTDSAIESYLKFCINTIFSIYKAWVVSPADTAPGLGTYNLYKF